MIEILHKILIFDKIATHFLFVFNLHFRYDQKSYFYLSRQTYLKPKKCLHHYFSFFLHSLCASLSVYIHMYINNFCESRKLSIFSDINVRWLGKCIFFPLYICIYRYTYVCMYAQIQTKCVFMHMYTYLRVMCIYKYKSARPENVHMQFSKNLCLMHTYTHTHTFT